MRLISYSGKTDIPYESTALRMEKVNAVYEIIALSVINKECPIIMGRYSTEEKAFKVMEMVRKEYEPTCYNGLPIPNFGYYFRFPADDEVEV